MLLFTIFIIVVTQKLVLQQSKNVLMYLKDINIFCIIFIIDHRMYYSSLRDLTSSMNIGYMFLRTHKLSVMLDGEEPVLHHQKGNIELVQTLAPGKSGLCFNDYTPTELSKLKLKTVNSRIKNVANIVKKSV